MPGSCGEEARHKKSPFLRCLGPERPKKGDFLCRALAGMPGSCGEAFKGSGLRAQGSGLRAQGLGEEARHKKSPFLRCFRPERLKKGDFLCRALAGKRPGTKSHLFWA